MKQNNISVGKSCPKIMYGLDGSITVIDQEGQVLSFRYTQVDPTTLSKLKPKLALQVQQVAQLLKSKRG